MVALAAKTSRFHPTKSILTMLKNPKTLGFQLSSDYPIA